MIEDEMGRSFVRRQRSGLFSLVFGYSCLLRPFPYSGNDLVRGFVPNSDCRGDRQLIHGLEGIGFALFPVCYRILEVIW